MIRPAPSLLLRGGRRRLLPRTVAARELVVVLSRPRALAIKLALPLLLSLILVAGHAPRFWAAMLLTVLVAMVGAVGTAVSVSRARETGFLARLAATPGSRPRIAGGWMLASAAIDLVQLLPVATAAILTGSDDPSAAAALLVALGSVLIVTNVLGCVVTLAAAGAAEVLLDVAVLLAPLLYFGGLFTGVPTAGWRSVVAALDPFSHLHSAFIGALGGTPTYAPMIDALAAAGAAMVALALLLALSRPILERG